MNKVEKIAAWTTGLSMTGLIFFMVMFATFCITHWLFGVIFLVLMAMATWGQHVLSNSKEFNKWYLNLKCNRKFDDASWKLISVLLKKVEKS